MTSGDYCEALETLAGEKLMPWETISYNHEANTLVFTTFDGFDYQLHANQDGTATVDVEWNSNITTYATTTLYNFHTPTEENARIYPPDQE